MEVFNGHIVLDDVPAVKLAKSSGNKKEDTMYGGGIVVHLDCPSVQSGVADLHVHMSCCQHKNGTGADALYRIVLLDEQYLLYFNETNPTTGQTVRCVSDKPISADNIYKLMERTKVEYAKSAGTRRLMKKNIIPANMIDCEQVSHANRNNYNAFYK